MATQKKKAGRPSKLTDEVLKKTTALASEPLDNRSIATFLGIHEKTLYEWLKPNKDGEDSDFCKAYALGKAKLTLDLASRVRDERNYAGPMWLLQKLCRGEWVDAATNEGSAISVSIQPMTDEEMEAMRKAIAKKREG